VTVIIDAGPLIALLNPHDEHHDWAERQAAEHPKPFFACEAVLAEATLLLEKCPGAPMAVMRLLERGNVKTAFNLAEQFQPVTELMAKYEDIPMSLADACLVRRSELQPSALIFTTDAHFGIYRRLKRQPIQTLAP